MNTEKLVKKVNKHDNDIIKVNEQLDNTVRKGEGGSVTWAMASQDFRENITSGNTAVVGKDSVLTENIVDKQVTPIKTSFLKQTKNLFNKLEVKKGYYWNVSTGEQVNSDFSYVIIPCEKGKKYIATGTSYNVCLFNSQGTRVGADNNSNGMANCIISTESYSEVAYFILSFRHATYPIDTYMVVEGEVLPSEYIEYGFKFDGKILFDNNSNILNVKKRWYRRFYKSL